MAVGRISLCGLPPSPNVATHDLLLRDSESSEWAGPPVALSAFQTRESAIARYGMGIGESQFTVRGDRWRYTRCGDDSEELFDREHDPNEWENRVGSDVDAEERARLKDSFDRLTPWTVPKGDGAGGS
jgi:hypothetical protein